MKRILFFLLLLFTGACNLFHHEAYKKIGPDLYFRLIRLGEKGRDAALGDYITVDLLYATADDSTFFHGTRKFLLEDSPYPGAINKVFLRLSKGDSASVFLSASRFFRNTLKRDLPGFIGEDDEMRVDIHLIDIQTPEDFNQEKRMFLSWAEELNSSEATLIRKFLLKEKLDIQPTKEGYYFVSLKEGKGKRVEKGRHIYIQYEGRFLNGKYFDSTLKRNDPLDFIYGSEYIVLRGIDDALGKMREGGKALVILPSDEAFGPEGSAGGIVPPWTALVYELEVLKVD